MTMPPNAHSISYSDVTVVLQGSYCPRSTPLALASVRKFLPGAKAVLSIWEGEQAEDADADMIIRSKDPGRNVRANLNRQLVSTRAGLEAVKTKYALKMRTDFELTGNNFLRHFARFKKRSENFKILEERVLCFGWRYRPSKNNKRLFHAGDFYHFGLAHDILKIFSVPLVYDPDRLQGAQPGPGAKFYSDSVNFSAEQYIWYTFLEQNCPGFFNGFARDVQNAVLLPLSEESYANNLVFLSYPEFSIRTRKDTLLKNNLGVNLTAYRLRDWLEMYKKYCDPSETFRAPRRPFSETLKLSLATAVMSFGKIAQIFTRGDESRRNTRIKYSRAANEIYFGEKF